jgi:hypothetical protein
MAGALAAFGYALLRSGRGRVAGALLLALALPVYGQSGAGWADGELPDTGGWDGGQSARLVRVARRGRHAKVKTKGKARAKAAPAISRMQMELAQEMVHYSYVLGQRLEPRQRVALMTRLLYTMRPEVMSAEKKQWAEELFGLALQLSAGDAAESAGQRNSAIATAATRVAVYDSDQALELLDSLPSQGGQREDARTMAARLVFAIYMGHHGAAGAQTLLAHGGKWGEQGGFPYGASAAALARLRANEDAAEDFFRQVLAVFARGQEGVFGVGDFAGLLERAVAMESISDESAEEAGRAVVAQLGKLAGSEAGGSEALKNGAEENAAAAKGTAGNDATGNDAAETQPAPLTEEQKRQVAEALNDVRLAAPKAYVQGAKDWPGLFGLRAAPVVTPVEDLKVDAGLQASFGELAESIRERRGAEAMQEVIARGLQRVNARYKAGGYAAMDAAPAAGALTPDAQSWALVSLAAYAAPLTIAEQLKAIEEPFWHAYFLAIAAQQVGEPTRVADPTARRVLGKEEAEPE